MAFLRVRGGSISLVHGVRSAKHGVRHERLYTFTGGVTELRARLDPKQWARLQVEVEQRHPSVAVDWERLRVEAEAIVARSGASAQAAVTPEQRIKALQKSCRILTRHLHSMGGGADGDWVMRCAGPALESVARQIVGRFHGLVKTQPRDPALLLGSLLPDAEAADVLVDRGRHAYQTGKRQKGHEAFEQARRLNPCDPDVDNSEGCMLLEARLFDEAEVLFERARKMAFQQLPDSLKSYRWSQLEVRPYIRATCNLGLLREKQGRLEDALVLFEECLRCCPQDGIGARFHIGPAHQRLGNLHRAIDHHRSHSRGNLVDPPDAFYDMAAAYIQLGKQSQALQCLLEGIEINDHIPSVLLKPPRRFQTSDSASVDSMEWAHAYVSVHGDFWTSDALQFLRLVWTDVEFKRGIEARGQMRAERARAESFEERMRAIDHLKVHDAELFGKKSVSALKKRLRAVQARLG